MAEIKKLYSRVKFLEKRLQECERALKINVPDITFLKEISQEEISDDGLIELSWQRVGKMKNRIEIVRDRCCLPNTAKVERLKLTTNQAIHAIRGDSMGNRSFAGKRNG